MACMISELSNKNNNVEILKVLCSYILSASFRSAIIASVNIEVEQELQQRRQRAHAAMLKLEKKHLVRITLFYVRNNLNSANIYKLFRNYQGGRRTRKNTKMRPNPILNIRKKNNSRLFKVGPQNISIINTCWQKVDIVSIFWNFLSKFLTKLKLLNFF